MHIPSAFLMIPMGASSSTLSSAGAPCFHHPLCFPPLLSSTFHRRSLLCTPHVPWVPPQHWHSASIGAPSATSRSPLWFPDITVTLTQHPQLYSRCQTPLINVHVSGAPPSPEKGPFSATDTVFLVFLRGHSLLKTQNHESRNKQGICNHICLSVLWKLFSGTICKFGPKKVNRV